MKKTIIGALAFTTVLSSGAIVNANNTEMAVPTLYNEAPVPVLIHGVPTLYNEIDAEKVIKGLFKKYELTIRNNKLESDYDYNNVHYFTKKMDASEIVIPVEIKRAAKKIYLLVEEGRASMPFMTEDAMMLKSNGTSEVKKVSNYKIVEFDATKDEYTFNSKDLVKEFSDKDYNSVTVTLMADFAGDIKMPLASPEYISMAHKTGILENLLREQKEEAGEDYYGNYYNSNDLEEYLEELSDKMDRTSYKNMLVKAKNKIKASQKVSKDAMEDMLEDIEKEAHFSSKVDDYEQIIDADDLLANLNRAVRSQLNNVRTFNAIDSLLK